MKKLLSSLTLAVALTATPASAASIHQYVESTSNLQGNFCTRYDAGVYNKLIEERFAGLNGYVQGNKKGVLRTRLAAFHALVATCTGTFPDFGVRLQKN